MRAFGAVEGWLRERCWTVPEGPETRALERRPRGFPGGHPPAALAGHGVPPPPHLAGRGHAQRGPRLPPPQRDSPARPAPLGRGRSGARGSGGVSSRRAGSLIRHLRATVPALGSGGLPQPVWRVGSVLKFCLGLSRVERAHIWRHGGVSVNGEPVEAQHIHCLPGDDVRVWYPEPTSTVRPEPDLPLACPLRGRLAAGRGQAPRAPLPPRPGRAVGHRGQRRRRALPDRRAATSRPRCARCTASTGTPRGCSSSPATPPPRESWPGSGPPASYGGSIWPW